MEIRDQFAGHRHIHTTPVDTTGVPRRVLFICYTEQTEDQPVEPIYTAVRRPSGQCRRASLAASNNLCGANSLTPKYEPISRCVRNRCLETRAAQRRSTSETGTSESASPTPMSVSIWAMRDNACPRDNRFHNFARTDSGTGVPSNSEATAYVLIPGIRMGKGEDQSPISDIGTA